MSGKFTLSSASKAIKVTAVKAASLYGTLGATSVGLYLCAQDIAVRYVEGGIWNSAAWTQHWSNAGDGARCLMYLTSAGTLGLITVLSAAIKYSCLRSDASLRTIIDPDNKQIVSPDQTLFEYDAILSVRVNHAPFEKQYDVGSLEITAMRFEEPKNQQYPGEFGIEQKVFAVPYQEKPYQLRDNLLAGNPTIEDLKGAINGISPSD